MQVCNKCWRRALAGIAPIGRPCPIPGCDGHIIHIDDDLGLVIQTLNRKGWQTTDSCSGHPDMSHFVRNGNCYRCLDNDTYIQFDKTYKFPSIPDGFELETYSHDDGSMTSVLRAAPFSHDDPVAAQYIIWDAARRLLEWAGSLPEK